MEGYPSFRTNRTSGNFGAPADCRCTGAWGDGCGMPFQRRLRPTRCNRHVMTTRIPDREAPRSTSWFLRPGCLILAIIMFLMLLLAVALFWRSAWWVDSGAPLPRGTDRLITPAGTLANWDISARQSKHTSAVQPAQGS